MRDFELLASYVPAWGLRRVAGDLRLPTPGQPRRAYQHFAQGIALAERLQMPYEEGLGHYHWGRFLPKADPARQTHLAQAWAIFERLGAAWDVTQAQVALTR